MLLAFVIAALPLMAAAQTKPSSALGVHKAEQLVARDLQLRAYEQPYVLASSASLIYLRCAKDLSISESEANFLKKRYGTLSNMYLQSFEDSHVAQFKVPSDAGITRDYSRYMADLRTPAVEKTAKAIKTAGCKYHSVKNVVEYFRKIQAAEEKGQKIPIVPIVKKRYL
jgi:hypothetical protein